MIYDLIAPIYDGINSTIDYVKWADFIENVINKNSSFSKESLVLDLGCGTGKMTVELAKRGYDMIGIDHSTEMLNIARESAFDNGLNNVLLLCQDIREFELYGTVEVIVSCLDTINHIVNRNDLSRVFSLAHNYLVDGGLFIFDINSEYKLIFNRIRIRMSVYQYI